jgi:hypothetical protein
MDDPWLFFWKDRQVRPIDGLLLARCSDDNFEENSHAAAEDFVEIKTARPTSRFLLTTIYLDDDRKVDPRPRSRA